MRKAGTGMSLKTALAALAGLCALLVADSAAQAASVNAGHLTAELVAETDGVVPGAPVRLALRQKIDDGWHTYWRNPGDSGQASTLTWSLPAGWTAGGLVWATPKPLLTGPLMSYGYEGEVLLPTSVTAPKSLRPGGIITLRAHAGFLACKDVCVPQDADLTLALPVVSAKPPPDPTWGPRIEAALAAAPRRAGLRAAMTVTRAAVKLSVVGPPLAGGKIHSVYFYPYDAAAIDQPKPQAVDLGPRGLTLTLAPGAAFKSGAAPSAMTGVLSVGDKAYEFEARAGPRLPGAAGLGPPRPAVTGATTAKKLLIAAASAFLGGLILDQMLRVFPIPTPNLVEDADRQAASS